MGKNVYFEALLVIFLTSGGLGRIMHSDIREHEMQINPFMNQYSSYGIIIFELLSFYFILYSNTTYKNIYLLIYVALVSFVTIYYVYSSPKILDTIKELFVYTPDIKSIFIHILLVLIMLYVVLYN
jgi:hypothetical protein